MDGCAGGGIEKFFYPGGPVVTSTTYRVMQYNVTHQKTGWTSETYQHLFDTATLPFSTRMQNVANVIENVAPDILCLAERHDEWAGIKHEDNPLVDKAVNLMDYLPSSYAIVQDNVTYEGVTAVNRVPILYNTSKFKCVESGFLKLTDEYSFSQSENKRIVTWAILEDITETANKGQKIAVFNTHWSIEGYNGRDYSDIRAAQSQEMQDLINSAKFADMTHVVCGDFNAYMYKNDKILIDLIDNCNLTHADIAVNGKVTFIYTVDNIAFSGAIVNMFGVIKNTVNAADHSPIWSDFTIQK